MNQQQALREARRRWGKRGALQTYPNGQRSVGEVVLGGLAFLVRGTGKTWAAAFAAVDETKHRDGLLHRSYGEPCALCSRSMRSPRLSRQVGEHAELGDVICESCHMNQALPRRFHGWSDRRRSHLLDATRTLHWWLVALGTWDVRKVHQREAEITRTLTAALNPRT